MRTQAACILRRDCSAEVVGDMFILNLWVKCVSACVHLPILLRNCWCKYCCTVHGQCVTLRFQRFSVGRGLSAIWVI